MLRGNALVWGGDGSFTLSFAPDGTNIAGNDSSLYATLNDLAPEHEWKEAILRAFQTWAAETNAAIGVVPDSGADFGADGASRRDPRFGDIRIGAAPLDPGVFAIAIPSDDILSGTWVGDVIFNSNVPLTSLEEVFAVALHEAGHVFGIEHSDDPLSPMHVHGITSITSLTSADVVAIQSLYGSPQPDLNEQSTSNDEPTSATQLKLNSVAGANPGSAPSLMYGVITSHSDVDFFGLATPEGYSGAITITLQSQEISLLAPRLTILDGEGAPLGEAVSISSEGNTLVVTLSHPPADGRLLIQVASGRSDVFGLGAYSLLAKFDDSNRVPDEIIAEAAGGGALRFLPQHELTKLFREAAAGDDPPDFNDDAHSDDESSSSVKLAPSPGFAANSRYEVVGSIADAEDVDFYRVTAPAAGGSVMTIRVRSLEQAGLIPKVTVLGKNGEELPVNVLVNGRGEFIIQVAGIEARDSVTFSVSSTEEGSSFSTGNYRLLVGFNDELIQPTPIAIGVLTPSQPILETALYVALPQLFHFALAVPPASTSACAAVMVTIRDDNNNVVFRVAARPGETRTAGSVLLKPGAYRVQIAGLSLEPLSADLSFTLSAKVSSDPFAADPDDPTFQPEFQCGDPEHEGLYCYPGHYVSPDPYLWDDFTQSLPELPTDLTFEELVQALLSDWWSWVWAQAGVDGPPLAQRDMFSLSAGGSSSSEPQPVTLPFNVLDNDIDPEHGEVVAILRSPASHGQLTLNSDGTVDYAPDEGFQGVDSFTYVAFDLVNESRETTVNIQVGFRGDYDASGVVDGADFLAWQRSLGQPGTPTGSGADGDADGVVTRFDAYVWAYNYGATAPPPTEEELASEAVEAPVELAAITEPLPLIEEDISRAAGGSTNAAGTLLLPSAEVPLLKQAKDGDQSPRPSNPKLVDAALATVSVEESLSTIKLKRSPQRPPHETRTHSVDRALEDLFAPTLRKHSK
jgi:hypothetical protein